MFNHHTTAIYLGIDPRPLDWDTRGQLRDLVNVSVLGHPANKADYAPAAEPLPHFAAIMLCSRNQVPESWMPAHADEAPVYLIPWAV